MKSNESIDNPYRSPLTSSDPLTKHWRCAKAIMGGLLVTATASLSGMMIVSQIVASLIRPDIIGGNVAYPQRGWAFWYVLSAIVILSVILGYVFMRQVLNRSTDRSGHPT
jgi:hypothetical protein